MTFSIAAADPSTEEVGVATQSKFLAVGAVVPWARAGLTSRANGTDQPTTADASRAMNTAFRRLQRVTK